MSRQLRAVAAWSVDAVCRVTGRRPVVRGARFALHRARLDLPNDPRRNGELRLQRWALALMPASEPMIVLDVGANVGEWSAAMLDQARRLAPGRPVRLHAFEPAPQAHQLLTAAVPEAVRLNQVAVSDQPGAATLHLVAPTAGVNTLHPPVGNGRPVSTRPVPATTIDDYLRTQQIRRVHLMKVDTEGNDLAVLRGARAAFAAGTIRLAQFEYNHRWVHARHFLKDAFDLLGPLGYRIGKLTPRGIEVYPGWDPELETFIEGNYLACPAEIARRLPRVAWWKRPREGSACTSE